MLLGASADFVARMRKKLDEAEDRSEGLARGSTAALRSTKGGDLPDDMTKLLDEEERRDPPDDGRLVAPRDRAEMRRFCARLRAAVPFGRSLVRERRPARGAEEDGEHEDDDDDAATDACDDEETSRRDNAARRAGDGAAFQEDEDDGRGLRVALESLEVSSVVVAPDPMTVVAPWW